MFYTPSSHYKYPHMAVLDVPVWESFLARYSADYIGFEYDVKVGSLPDFGYDLSPEMAKDAHVLYSKKIDAIGYTNDKKIHIIEVKPIAHLSTVGQVLGYLHLYKRDFFPPPDVQLSSIIVAKTASLDTLEFCAVHGVDCRLVSA